MVQKKTRRTREKISAPSSEIFFRSHIVPCSMILFQIYWNGLEVQEYMSRCIYRFDTTWFQTRFWKVSDLLYGDSGGETPHKYCGTPYPDHVVRRFFQGMNFRHIETGLESLGENKFAHQNFTSTDIPTGPSAKVTWKKKSPRNRRIMKPQTFDHLWNRQTEIYDPWNFPD